MKKLCTFFTTFILFCIFQIKQVYNLEFLVRNQAEWNAAFTTLENYPNRIYLEEIRFAGYILQYVDTNDISRLRVLKDMVSLKTIFFQVRQIKGLTPNSLNHLYDAIKDLPNVTYLYIYAAHTFQGNQDGFANVLRNFKKLTYLYYNIYDNNINNICRSVQYLDGLTELRHLDLHVGTDPLSDISCYQNMFLPLTKLTYLSVGFTRCDVTNISFLSNSFDTLQSLTTLRLYATYNPIATFTLQESFLKLVNLKTMTFEVAPESQSVVWQNVTIVHPNIETMRYVVGPYLDTSNELFDHLPSLKRAEFRWNEYYKKSTFQRVINQLAQIPNLNYLWLYYYVIHDQAANDLYFSQLGDVLAPVKNKIKTIEISDHYTYKTFDYNNLKTSLTDAKLPNLERLVILRDGQRGTGSNYVVPQLNHSKMTSFYYRVYRGNHIKDKWALHQNLWDNLPNLKNPQLTLDRCDFTNAMMNGFVHFFKSLQGRTFTDFYLNLNNNKLNGFTNLINTYTPFKVTNNLAYFYLHNNEFANLNGIQNFFKSIVDPVGTKKILFYAVSNQIADASQLQNSFSSFSDLEDLRIYLFRNKITDLNQFQGLYDNKPNLKVAFFETRENSLTDQSQFTEVTKPLSYFRGKAKMSHFTVDFSDPGRGTITNFTGMEADGQYLSVQKYGFCVSDYNYAKRFVLGTNVCTNCVESACYSCSKADRCDVCRISDPPRELPLCTCPDGYYSAQDYTCLKCGGKCTTCDNGNDCLTCVNSIPKRFTALCICPDGYYDDGVQDQCQTCKTGCNTCKDGISCLDCIDGYYQKGSQCLLCPQHFSSCELDPNDSSVILSKQCQGQNRYYILPFCECIEGYYPIPNFADCIPCNIKCTQCTSAKKCQACAVKYYHDPETESCNRCHIKCKSCVNADACETCDDRQFDPSTYCLQKYSAGGSSSGGSSGGNGTGSGTNTGGNTGSNGNGSGSNGSGSGSDGNGSNGDGGNSDGNGSGSGSDGNGNQSGQNGDGSNGSDNGSNGNGSGSNGSGSNGNDSGSNGSGNGSNGSGNDSNGNLDENTTGSFSMFNPVTNRVEVLKCDFNCDTCSDDNLCSTCIVGLNRLQNPPLCSCKDGYHNKKNTTIDCFKCPIKCKSCQSQEECTSCRESDNRYHNQYTMQCECNKGYKEVHNENVCKPCFQYKDSCLLQCPVYTVQDQSSRTCQDIIQVSSQSSHLAIYIYCGFFLVLAIVTTKCILSKLIGFNQYQKVNDQMQQNCQQKLSQVKQISDSNSNSNDDENV